MTPAETALLVYLVLSTGTSLLVYWGVYRMMVGLFDSNRKLWECYIKDSRQRSDELDMMAEVAKDLDATNRALKEARRRAEEEE